MKRRARYSLIIVVLVVILGMGFGVWKMFFAPEPLKIKDLENMHITTTRSSIHDGWDLQIRDTPGGKIWAYGTVGDNGNISDVWGTWTDSLAVELLIREANEQLNIQAGDTLEIIYDGGQTLKIYLPRLTTTGNGDLVLYIAADGSTYYDKHLTNLAQKVPISEKDK